MKIEVLVQLDENQKPVHALIVEGKPVMGMPTCVAVNDILAVFFKATEIGIVVEMRVGQAVVGQFIFMSCAGSSGWLKTAERLQKTVHDIIIELDTKELEVGTYTTETEGTSTCALVELGAPGKQIIVPGQGNPGAIAFPGQTPKR